jgi:hypothetical protein
MKRARLLLGFLPDASLVIEDFVREGFIFVSGKLLPLAVQSEVQRRNVKIKMRVSLQYPFIEGTYSGL